MRMRPVWVPISEFDACPVFMSAVPSKLKADKAHQPPLHFFRKLKVEGCEHGRAC